MKQKNFDSWWWRVLCSWRALVVLWTPGAWEEGRGGTQQEEKAAQAEVMCLAAVPPALGSGRKESRGSRLGGKAAMPGGLCRGGQELQDAGAWRMQKHSLDSHLFSCRSSDPGYWKQGLDSCWINNKCIKVVFCFSFLKQKHFHSSVFLQERARYEMMRCFEIFIQALREGFFTPVHVVMGYWFGQRYFFPLILVLFQWNNKKSSIWIYGILM